MRIRSLAMSSTVLVLFSASISAADTLTMPVEAIKVIDNGAGAQRVLLKLGPIEGIGEMAISRAYLVLRTARRGEVTAPLELQVHPITRDWTPESVSWNTGWTRAGGDLAEEEYARATVDPSQLGEEVRINVESLIGQMRYGAQYYGFVVTALPYQRVGLRSADLERLPSLTEARLIVEYEPMPRVQVPQRVR